MPNGIAFALVMVLFAAQLTDTRACDSDSTQTPPPTPPAPQPPTPVPPTPTPSGDVFVTSDGVRFRVEEPVGSLEVPWSMAFAPDGRLFVTERAGRVRILDLASSSSELALTLDDVYRQSEAGLLGIALAPDFAQSRLVYLHYTAQLPGGSTVNRIVRYREAGGRLSERAVLLDGIPAAGIHDGGRLKFGPDGLLYITAGDANVSSRAQDAASLAGKILRIAPDGSTPRDNPFSSPVFSLGHRNPQGLDWHPVTGELWSSEHGQTGNDEINVIRSGLNFGWPRIEGSAAMAGMETPVTSFSPAIAPSGAAFYRGTRFPQFANDLFVATLQGRHLLRLRVDGAGRRVISQERLLDGRYGRLRDVVSGPDGAIYVATSNRESRGTPAATDDRILRLVPAQ